MKGSVLITDSLFISKENEDLIREGGYEIERLDIPKATEEQLITAIRGKVGYILGGVEEVNQRVIDAADVLKAIVFTGIGYKDFIVAHEYATKKGIAIANTPDGPTHAVAEWALTAALMMNRHFLELGGTGTKTFMTTRGLEGVNVGIVGYGRIGKHIEEMLAPFKPASVKHSSHTNSSGSIPLDVLLKESDVIFVCVSKDAGENYINAEQLALMKDDALLVSFMHYGIINEQALLKELGVGRIRAISDAPAHDAAFKSLPPSHWFSFNGSNAFNTDTEIKLVSDTVTQSLLNLLETGTDLYRVN